MTSLATGLSDGTILGSKETRTAAGCGPAPFTATTKFIRLFNAQYMLRSP